MKKHVFLLLGLSMVLLLSACGQDSASGDSANSGDSGKPGEKTFNLKLAHTTSETHIFHNASVQFADSVKEKTGGRVTFTIYPSGQLGNDIELIEQVMNGEIDALVVGAPFFSGFTPVLDSYLLPFLIDNYDIEREVLNASITREMLDSLDDLGIKGLTMFEGGLVHIGNSKREIKKPEDMKGLKLRIASSDLAVNSIKALGATPTPMVLTEVYSGLQTNVIDGVQTNLITINSSKFYEVIKYISILGQYPFPAVVAVNKEVFDRLSEADQTALLEAAKEATDFTLSEVERLDEESKGEIEKAGVQITTLTAEEKQAFVDATQNIYNEYMNKNPLIEKFVNTVQAMKKN